MSVITARKRSLGQGNIFAPVCHSVHRGGVPGQLPPPPGQVHSPQQVHPPGQVPPTGTTPPRQVHPPAGTPPGQVHPPGRYSPGRYTPRTGTPPGRYTPRQVPPPGNACWDAVNKRSVRILLECILVTAVVIGITDRISDGLILSVIHRVTIAQC